MAGNGTICFNFNQILLTALLIHCLRDLPYRLRISHSIIMQAGRAILFQLFRLLDAPFDTRLQAPLGIFGRLYGLDQVFRQVDVEDAGDGIELIQLGERLQARHDRHIDADFPAAGHEFEVFFVVKKHLGDDIVGAGIDLGLGLQQVEVKVRRFEVLLRVAGHADAEIRPHAILDIVVQVSALIHIDDLFDQVDSEVVAALFRNELTLELPRIAANGQHIVDVQEVKVDQGIFRVFPGKASADQVRYGVDSIAVHNSGADAHRARPLADGHLLVVAAGALFVNELLPVVGHVDEGRLELHERVEGVKDGLHTAALEGGQHFEGYEGLALRFFKVFSDFHTPFCCDSSYVRGKNTE